MIDLLESPLFPISDYKETKTPPVHFGIKQKTAIQRAGQMGHSGGQMLKQTQTFNLNPLFQVSLSSDRYEKVEDYTN